MKFFAGASPEALKDWADDCAKWRGRPLTGEYSHWCNEWDGLPIDETCPEWPCCSVAQEGTPVPEIDHESLASAIRELTEPTLPVEEPRPLTEKDTAGLPGSACEGSREDWKPIATAPEATYVLLFVPNHGYNIGSGTQDPSFPEAGMDWFIRGENERCWPTHWMPLPPMPNGRRS